MKYYVLEKTQECRDFFFNNEGIFNFWDEYVIVHLNELGDRHPVLVNRTGRKFHGGYITPEAKRILNKRLKNVTLGMI